MGSVNISTLLDPNGAHFPVLAALLQNTTGPVLELGTGNFSTPLIYFMCPNRFCISIDNNKEWYEFYRNKFGNRFHYFIHTDLISEKLEKHLFTCNEFKNTIWDVVFIDHSPAEDRVKCIELLRNRARYIIVHDTEKDAMVYNWGNIWDTFKYKYYWEFFGRNGTTIISNEPIPVRENYYDIPKPANGKIEDVKIEMPKINIDEYITGEKFEALCDIDCEKDKDWQQAIKDSTKDVLTIFCQTHKLKEFISFGKKFILISHNSDGAIEYNPIRWDSIKYNNITNQNGFTGWFGQNVNVNDSDIIPIPIGLENLYIFKKHIKQERMERLINENIPKENKMFICLNRYTNCEQRSNAYRIFKNLDWVTIQEGKNGMQDVVTYFDTMIRHKFVLCPDGNGMDTVRTWETLYMGAIPIVFRHEFTEYFAEYLPMIVIDSYTEPNPAFLNNKMKEMQNKEFNFEMLKMSYWRNQIEIRIHNSI
uniref:Exostosin GT47 domain-containing protein n=1 Tax=viral metagenome TaxID=1070528 RepID=A0A6M3M5P0_9ZZZZ